MSELGCSVSIYNVSKPDKVVICDITLTESAGLILKNLIETSEEFKDSGFAYLYIDVVGGVNLKKQYGAQALSVFIKASSVAVLKERLVARNTEDEVNLNMRLEKAEEEMTFANDFDIVIVNDDLKTAQEEAFQKVTDFING